jgi:alpha-N-arabinofuranosidase
VAIQINTKDTIGKIQPELHGQFIEFLGSCIDDGLWVGEDSPIANECGIRVDVLNALKRLQPPMLRWPGGCYADRYHWRDGIGPRDHRPVTFNENFGTYELDRHQFGTDEFLNLCEQVGAQPWISVNMLTGTPREMVEWMEYCNRREPTTLAQERAKNGHPEPYHVRYWGIGNEVWGGGGTLTPEAYVDQYRRFSSAIPSFTRVIGEQSDMYAIASGPDGNKPNERVNWTKDLFDELARYRQPKINGYDAHFYNWNITHEDDTSTKYTKEGWSRLIKGCLELEDEILRQSQMIQKGLAGMPLPEVAADPRLQHIDLIVGEWGNWHRDATVARPALYQQATIRDAITTALTLDVLQRNCDTVSMACNAQTINVLNALILTDGENMALTPNYHVFEMYKVHRGAMAIRLPRQDEESKVYQFASVKDNDITVDLINACTDKGVDVDLAFDSPVKAQSMISLASNDLYACNVPGERPRLAPTHEALTSVQGTKVTVALKPASVNTLRFKIAA